MAPTVLSPFPDRMRLRSGQRFLSFSAGLFATTSVMGCRFAHAFPVRSSTTTATPHVKCQCRLRTALPEYKRNNCTLAPGDDLRRHRNCVVQPICYRFRELGLCPFATGCRFLHPRLGIIGRTIRQALQPLLQRAAVFDNNMKETIHAAKAAQDKLIQRPRRVFAFRILWLFCELLIDVPKQCSQR